MTEQEIQETLQQIADLMGPLFDALFGDFGKGNQK